MKRQHLLPGLLTGLILWNFFHAGAQTQPGRSSHLSYTAGDSTRIFTLLDEAEKYKGRLPDSAQRYYTAALGLSASKSMLRGEAYARLGIADMRYRASAWPAMQTEDSIVLQLGLRLKDSFLIAMAWYGLGQAAQSTNRKDEALTDFQKALSLQLEKDQSTHTASVYNDLGYLYGTRGEMGRQQEWYLKAMRLYDRNGDEEGMAQTLSNLSGSALEMGKKKDAIVYAARALAIREKGQDKEALSLSYNNISQIYLQADSPDQALHYQQEGLKYARLSGSKIRLAQSYTSMSLLMNKRGKNKEALEFEQKAIAICRETGDSGMLGRRYIAAAFLSGALKDSAGAVAYFDLAAKVSGAIDDKFNLRDLYLYRTIFYKERKDFFQAYQNLKLYHAYKDSILDAQTTSNIAEIQARYETEKKDKSIGELQASEKIKQLEIEKQKAMLHQQTQTRNIMIGGIIGLFLMTAILFNRYQLKKRLEQQQAVMEMRNNIARDLHDELGSTLTSIHILSQVSRNHLADDRAGTFSLLEKITDQSRQMQQSMSDIVWAIRSDNDKIENMMVRMREYLAHTLEAKDISIGFQASEELLGHSFSMQQRKDIFLIFKEAVNNAAKYAGCTRMDVSFRRCEERILLEVRDNGIGFDQETVRSSSGLKNMKSRALALQGTFRIESASGKGTMVRLDLPATT